MKSFKHLCAMFLLVGLIVQLASCREGSAVSISGGTTGEGATGELPPDISTDVCVDPLLGTVDSTKLFVRPLQFKTDSSGTYCPTNYKVHKSGESWSSACEVSEDEPLGSLNRDITCVIEAPEEDLYFHGLSFQYNVPPGMCYYFVQAPYYFENFEIGVGPTSISIDVIDGVAGLDGNSDGDFADGGDTVYPTTWATASGGFYVQDGSPVCVYNHSDRDAEFPNCCIGEYSLIKRTWNGASYDVDDPANPDWGGEPASCLAGAAMDTQSKTDEGYPINDVFFTAIRGLNDAYIMDPLMERLLGSTVHIANYYNSADHGAPLAPRALSSSVSTAFYRRNYTYLCLDRGYEVLARIQVQVREWNEYAQWALETAGNPDTTGTEPNFPDQQLNDYSDWKDWDATLPGFH